MDKKLVSIKTTPLQACGCYVLIILSNLAFWGALIFTVVKIAKWAWS